MRRVLTRDQLNRLVSAQWLRRGGTTRTGRTRHLIVLGACAVLAIGVVALVSISEPATAAVSPGVTERISVNNDGTQASGVSFGPSVSSDGRYVAFTTTAPIDPIDGSTDQNVYVRDTVAHTTKLISLGQDVEQPSPTPSDGGPILLGRPGGGTIDGGGGGLPIVKPAAVGDIHDGPGNGASFDPSMSATGRYIAFTTQATNIPANSNNSNRTVLCDRDATNSGTFGKCTYVPLGNPGTQVENAVLDANADRVAFVKDFQTVEYADLPHGTNDDLPPTSDSDFHVATLPPTVTSAGKVYNRGFAQGLAISGNGRFLAIVEDYRDATSTTGFPRFTVLFVYDVNTGTATRLDLGENLQPLGSLSNEIGSPAISGDGRIVAFDDAVDSAAGMVVYVIDRDPDANGNFGPTSTEHVTSAIVSRNKSGAVAGGRAPALSSDGRYIAFATDSGNVHNGVDDTIRTVSCVHPGGDAVTSAATPPADTGISFCDVVVRDLVVDAARARAGAPRLPAELASPSINTTCLAFVPGATCEGNGDSTNPVLTGDGSAVFYESVASDLVSGDTNNDSDVFMRRFTPSLTIPTADFGSEPVGDSETLAVPVTTNGFGPLTIGAGIPAIGGPQGGDYTVTGGDCPTAVLHETETCLVNVKFAPTAQGARDGTLSLTPVGGKPVTGQLVGAAGPPRTPNFQAAPNPLDFGPNLVVTPTPAKTITVTNTGTNNLTITAVASPPPSSTNFAGDYTVNASNCLGVSIPPGGTCTVSVVFSGQNVGPRPALLLFTDNAAPLSHVVSLNGSGIQPAITASPPLAPPGGVSQITGTGWPANKQVQLALDLMPPQTTQPTADANGNFTFPFVIFPHTSPGNRFLHATVPTVPQLVAVNITFLVVPGSLQPPDFAERR